MTIFSKQLTTLKLPIKTGFIEWVCGFDCQLRALIIDRRNSIQTALETLSRFSQRTFLKKLKILGHSEFDPAPLKELSHLNKLNISCLGMALHSKIDIVSVLRSCPDNMTSLILYDVILKDELPMDHTLALQELKIYSRSSSLKQFNLFLSKCCPQLRSLTLDSCFSAGDDLNLSDLSLLYIKIVLLFPGNGMEGGSSLYSLPNSGITRLMSTAGVTRLAVLRFNSESYGWLVLRLFEL